MTGGSVAVNFHTSIDQRISSLERQSDYVHYIVEKLNDYVIFSAICADPDVSALLSG